MQKLGRGEGEAVKSLMSYSQSRKIADEDFDRLLEVMRAVLSGSMDNLEAKVSVPMDKLKTEFSGSENRLGPVRRKSRAVVGTDHGQPVPRYTDDTDYRDFEKREDSLDRPELNGEWGSGESHPGVQPPKETHGQSTGDVH